MTQSSIPRNVFKGCSNTIKVGNYPLIKGNPVKITNFRFLIPGKHGHKKSIMKGINLIDGSIVTKRSCISCFQLLF